MRVPRPFGNKEVPSSPQPVQESACGKGKSWTDEAGDLPILTAQRIAARAAAAPHACAVGGKSPLTYGELERKSNRLARYLESLGCRAETLVAIAAGRSPELIIAALAVWKAGGAYLPIDPSWPSDRVQYVLDDAGAPIILVSAPGLSSIARKQIVIDLNEAEATLEIFSDAPLSGPQSASQLAYVIYTSGSTGTPKGVEITHGNLLNLIDWHISAFRTTSNDRATLLASPGFDASVWEIWPALCSGASLHIPDERTRLSPESLRDWLVSEGVTISFAPTPIAQRLMFLNWPAETRLRLLLTGADVLQKYPPPGLPFAVINNYGPTECAVVATSGQLSPEQPQEMPPSIGKPISNTMIRILDANGNAVATGQAGELCIGGASVGRGYRGDPALTREKFFPDPFSPNPAARLYRTGDRARMFRDGSIEFLGRLDDQIKLHGYRIDPNEIATLLCRHPRIQASFVRKATDPSSGAESLVAYLVPVGGSALDARELREHLRPHLPAYMIPAAFVALACLPLNASGKIDREALPSPNNSNTLPELAAMPQTNGYASETEIALSAMLSKLLSRGPIGAHDNFFLAGGHSLLGAQLLIQIRSKFGVELPLRTIFDYPTIAGIAAQIEGYAAPAQNRSLAPASQGAAL